MSDRGCHIQKMTAAQTNTASDLFTSKFPITHTITELGKCAAEHVHPTCMSSLGTSSYVLESVDVLLEDVAHLGETEGERGEINLCGVKTSLS